MKKLTEKELTLVTEALLFASCADICAEWDEEIRNQFIELAIKLKGTDEVKLENIYLFGFAKQYEDKDAARKIKKNFKIRVER
jgi:hypothetical protein